MCPDLLMWSDSVNRNGSFRLDPALALIVAGACCVVLGGLVAAVTGPLDLEHGSWLAAYLVLVCGVAQYAMGRVRIWRRPETPTSPARAWAQFGGWNLGNAAVIAGTLVDTSLLVDAGSVLLVVALLIALRATWPGAVRLAEAAPLVIWAYRILLIILVVSIPIGILLSHLRNS